MRQFFKIETDPVVLLMRAYDMNYWGYKKDAQKLMDRACIEATKEGYSVPEFQEKKARKAAKDDAWWHWG